MNTVRRSAALAGLWAHAARTTRLAPAAMPVAARAISSSCPVWAAAAAAGKKKQLDASIPLPPRGPPSAYVLFFKDFFAKHGAEYTSPEGKVRASEAAKAAGKEWNALDAAAQRPFVAEGKARSDAYKREYAAYYAGLAPTQLAALNAHLPRPLPVPAEHPSYPGKTAAEKSARRTRTGEPPKGTTGFFAFLAELRASDEFKKMMQDEGITQAAAAVFGAKKAGQKWGVMSEAEKKVYADKAASSRAAYKEWKDKQSS